MKNLKKVLAMVLAFACTFTMFAGAKVFDDVPAGSDYSEAITMLSDLGVIQGKDDGYYHPEDTITRAEACAMIARLMTGDPHVSQYTGAQNFADVAKGSWKDSAIGYCYINNIVVGVGNNKFEPDRAITDAEFVTMVVRAMGYETPDMTQGYPYSYMSNAQAIGLLDDVNMVASTDALRGEDAQVIYNALFTDYARGAMLVNTTHGTSVESYPTLAESVWDLSKAAVGEWEKNSSDDETAELTNCKAHTWVVIGADPAEEDHILAYPIDDDTTDLYDSGEKNAYKAYSFKYEGDVESVKGYQVELWGEGSHGEATWEKGEDKFVYSEDWNIKAIKTVKGQTKFDYNPSMADSKDDNGTIVLDDDTSLDLGSVADNAKHVDVSVGGYRQLFVAKNYNGESDMDTDKKVEAALNVRDGAQYQLMDWDSDGNVDWVVVDEARYFKVESVSSKRMTVSSMSTKNPWETSKDSVKDTWKLDDSNDMGKNAAGKTIKVTYEVPDGIEEGDILEVTYTSKFDGDEVVTATVSVIDAESKSLDKVSTKDGLTLTFDDEEIAVAQNVEENDVIVPANPSIYRDFNSEELGTDFDLYLNRNGFIVYSDYTTDTANYAMILDTKNGSDVLSNRGLAKVDLLTGGNEHLKGVELTSTASVEGNGYNSNSRTWTETDVVGQVYKYWTNEDGQITRMRRVIDNVNTSAANSSTNEDTITGENYSYDADADRLVKSDATTGANEKYVASLEDADIIFAVKPNTESAKNNGAGITTVNDGYIQAEKKTSGTAGSYTDLYVDADDVLAVKQSDIPDIEKIGAGTDDTDAAYLDNAVNATSTSRIATWLGANNKDAAGTGAGNADWLGTFIASVDKNGAASAAVLGVKDFNKFNAGSTKIGLVTDVAYRNTADGKVVELTGAFGGENKTITSAKKVDFGDIVKAYNGVNDISIDNPSATVATNLFNGANLDKYLEDGAAYAEIVTDADGNLTKVTFLDADAQDTNKLNGHYYTVSRNVTLGATEKNVNYLLNDGTTHSELSGATYVAKQVYANSDALYSINSLPKENSKLTSDTTFYEIDGKPTLTTGYNGKQLSVVNGFDGTPDITAGGDYGVIDSSMIDQENNNKDDYGVADIVLANNGDVAAVYAFNDSFDEVSATDVAVVSMTDSTGKPITSAKAGDNVQLTAVVVDSDTNKNVSGLQIVDANGNDVSTAWNVTAGEDTPVDKDYTDSTVTIPKTASGKYTIYALNGAGKQYTVGALVVEVTDGKLYTYDITGIKFAYQDANKAWQDDLQVDAAAKNTFYVAVEGTTNGTTPLAIGQNLVSGLTAANFEVLVKNMTVDIYSVTETATPGIYQIVLKNDLTAGDNVVVKVKAGGVATNVSAVANGVTDTVSVIGSTTDSGSVETATAQVVTVDAAGVGGSLFTIKLMDANGNALMVDSSIIKVVEDVSAEVTSLGNGLYQITSTEDLSTGATIKVGTNKITIEGLTAGTTATITAMSAKNYELMSAASTTTAIDLFTAAATLSNLAADDVKVVVDEVNVNGAADADALTIIQNAVKWNSTTKKVQIAPSVLDTTLDTGDTIKLHLEAKSDATVKGSAVTVNMTAPEIKYTAVAYDLAKPTEMQVTLDKAVTSAKAKVAIETATNWAMPNVGATLFTGTGSVTVTTAKLGDDNKTVTLTLNVPSTVGFDGDITANTASNFLGTMSAFGSDVVKSDTLSADTSFAATVTKLNLTGTTVATVADSQDIVLTFADSIDVTALASELSTGKAGIKIQTSGEGNVFGTTVAIGSGTVTKDGDHGIKISTQTDKISQTDTTIAIELPATKLSQKIVLTGTITPKS